MKVEPDLEDIRLFSPGIPDDVFSGFIEPPPCLKDWSLHLSVLHEMRTAINDLRALGLVTRRSEWLRVIARCVLLEVTQHPTVLLRTNHPFLFSCRQWRLPQTLVAICGGQYPSLFNVSRADCEARNHG